MGSTEIVMVRHGTTEWSAEGRHTGHTDVPLSPRGRAQVEALRARIGDEHFVLVLASPLQRARETAELCGFGAGAVIDDDLREWDYGDYEGRTTTSIRSEHPGWTLWRDGVPHGETAFDVGRRADRVVARAVDAGGRVCLFGHGHFLRVLTARWLGLKPADGCLFMLGTATLSVLGYERETRVIERWNT